MEIYLASNAALLFTGPGTFLFMEPGKFMRTSNPIKIKLLPVVKDDEARKYCNAFATSLIENSSRWKSIEEDQNISSFLRVSLTLSAGESGFGRVAIWHDPKDGKGDSIFTRMKTVFEKCPPMINVTLKLPFPYSYPFKLQVKDLPIMNLSGHGISETEGCEFNQIPFSEMAWQAWNTKSAAFNGSISISVSLDHEAMNYLHLEDFPKPEILKGFKELLDQAICSDLVLVAGNGKKIKCHRAILSMHSPVFKTMIENKQKSVDMRDMSEAGIRAFLAFTYYYDLKAASEKFEIALELLRAGHLFEMETLTNVTGCLICAKPIEWFKMDDTLKLLILTRTMADSDLKNKLERKSVGVLKGLNVANRDNIVESEEFRKLFTDHPNDALGILALVMKYLK